MKSERIEPGPGQESVWDYPRPPRCEPCSRQIEVIVDDLRLASSNSSKRVLETSHPPVFYIPPEDILMEHLFPTFGKTWCEWKGDASYYDLHIGDRVIASVAWTYRSPSPAFAAIRDHLAFYPSRVDACFVDGERVQSQPGDFYGGWITSDIVGPFKGSPGTMGW
jgi:uncharacterized protein (DUF427 family)